MLAAYWIAFGPHGPRAEAPPGESWKVARYTAYGVLASVVIFSLTRYFARPAPRTMTKEYQELSNEYLRVRHSYFPLYHNTGHALLEVANAVVCRVKNPSRSPASRPRTTRAREWFKASRLERDPIPQTQSRFTPYLLLSKALSILGDQDDNCILLSRERLEFARYPLAKAVESYSRTSSPLYKLEAFSISVYCCCNRVMLRRNSKSVMQCSVGCQFSPRTSTRVYGFWNMIANHSTAT